MIFKLVKDGEVYLKPYGMAQGISEVFTVPHIPSNSLPLGDLLNRYRELLMGVPCFEMHFTRDERFWKAINDELAKSQKLDGKVESSTCKACES